MKIARNFHFCTGPRMLPAGNWLLENDPRDSSPKTTGVEGRGYAQVEL
jgi:hypothetical protein